MSNRRLIAWALLFVALAFTGAGGLELFTKDEGPSRAALGGRVVRVVDGDTVRVRLDGSRRTETVRYIGVDTPETVKPGEPVQCFGKAASAFNRRLVAGRRVRLEQGRERRDRYGRLLAYVRVESGLRGQRVLVEDALLRGGYARTLAIPPNTDRAVHFGRLAREARRTGRGLWGACQ